MPNRGNQSKVDDRSQGREEEAQEGAAVATENNAHSSGVDQLTQAVQSLRQRRIAAVEEVGTIDQRLIELRDEITQLMGENAVDEQSPTRTRGAQKPKASSRGRTPRNANKSQRSRGGRRNANGQSGTVIIEEILREHKGRMESGECAKLAVDRGVKWPHSSFQSLKKRGRIELKDGFVEFTDIK